MAQKASLADKVRNQETIETVVRTPRTAAVSQITSSDGNKDKQISAKVNEKVYAMFTKINKEQGLSNNSALNMIINKYVRENKGILSDLD